MAINFLNNVNLNSIQVENIVIEKFASDAAAGTGVVGQLYFDTTADTLKQYVSDTGGGAAGTPTADGRTRPRATRARVRGHRAVRARRTRQTRGAGQTTF